MPGWIATDHRVVSNLRKGHADRIRERAPLMVQHYQDKVLEAERLGRQYNVDYYGSKLKWWTSRLPKD